MRLQLCNLEQTMLKVFRYGRLIRDKTRVTPGGKTRIGRVSLATAADEACGRCCRWRWNETALRWSQ
jgi:hypothetical protein